MTPTLGSIISTVVEAAFCDEFERALDFRCTVNDPLIYAIRKRQLLLDAKPSMSESAAVSEIIKGLPQEKRSAFETNVYNNFHDFTSDLIRIDFGALSYIRWIIVRLIFHL